MTVWMGALLALGLWAPAKVVTLEESGIAFTLPAGWKTSQTQKGLAVHPAEVDPNMGALTALSAPTAPELVAQSLEEVIAFGAQQFAAELSAAAAAAGGAARFGQPESRVMQVAGQRAGRFLVEASLFADGVTQELDIYVGMVVTPDWTFTLLGSWPKARATVFRSQADVVLKSFRVAAPRSDAAAAKQLAGCWNRHESSTSASGSVSVDETLTLNADGTFERRSLSQASVAGVSGTSGGGTVTGRWQALAGGRVVFTTSSGERTEQRLVRQGGKLVAGSAQFLPCR